MSSKRISDGAVCALALLLIVPPIAQVGWREHRARSAAAAGAPEQALEALRRELDLARNELGLRAEEERVLARWREAHTPLPLRVLPVEDVSPGRHSLWAAAQGKAPLEEGLAVVSGEALLGRIAACHFGGSVAQVQTVLDRRFVVRFRYGEVQGFLRGTGEIDGASGRAFLDISLVERDVTLRPGDHVFTDSSDRRFPAGILIGELSAAPAEVKESYGGCRVLAAPDFDALREVAALRDDQLGAARVTVSRPDERR